MSFFSSRRRHARLQGDWSSDVCSSDLYLGSHSDKHLLYCDWTTRDSLLVTRQEFDTDLKHSYDELSRFGIKKSDARSEERRVGKTNNAYVLPYVHHEQIMRD